MRAGPRGSGFCGRLHHRELRAYHRVSTPFSKVWTNHAFPLPVRKVKIVGIAFRAHHWLHRAWILLFALPATNFAFEFHHPFHPAGFAVMADAFEFSVSEAHTFIEIEVFRQRRPGLRMAQIILRILPSLKYQDVVKAYRPATCIMP